MRFLLLFIVWTGTSLLCGCSKATGPQKVSGMVKMDDAPLAEADLRFVPKENMTLGEFGGRTRPDGTYSIELGGPGKTVKAGTYVALVSKGLGIGGPLAPTEEGEIPPSSAGSLPAKYGTAETSPFIVEIKDGETDLPPFELKNEP